MLFKGVSSSNCPKFIKRCLFGHTACMPCPAFLSYRILSFKRPERLYIFFDFGVGVYSRGALNRAGCLFKKLDFLSNSLLSLGAIQ